MPEHFPLIVPGAKPEGDPIEVHAPYDRSLIATVDNAGRDAVEQALATAYGLYRDRDAWLAPAERIEILRRAADIMRSRREGLALEAAREGGKPLGDSLVEADRAIDGMNLCVEFLRTQHGTEVPMNLNAASKGHLAFTTHEPIGVVVAYSAFNHPLNLIVHQVGPAIAAGCPTIVKPAKATPGSCWRFVRILQEAGLPEPWCQTLLCSNDLSVEMIADERTAFLSFIGSAKVGWMLRSKLAPGARCALEHGGIAPVVVAADADLDDALPRLMKAGFYHAGQVCVSVQRVFAERGVARELAERMAEQAQNLTVADPTEKGTDVGPLIRTGEVDRVDQWLKEAVDAGAEKLCGGEPIFPSPSGRGAGDEGDGVPTCYAPTILFNPPDDSKVMKHEVFGPVVSVCPVDSIDEAIARANDTPFSFQASVFTRNLDTALRASRRLDASAVMVNQHTAFRVDWMPFAGLKHSGYGTGGIPFTMEDMQVEKMTVIRSDELV